MYITTKCYTLKVLNPKSNQRAASMLNSYNSWGENSTIHTIYGKPCKSNVEAFYALKDECANESGINLRCGNPTCHSWCLGYKVKVGSTIYLIYHTRENVYCIYVKEC